MNDVNKYSLIIFALAIPLVVLAVGLLIAGSRFTRLNIKNRIILVLLSVLFLDQELTQGYLYELVRAWHITSSRGDQDISEKLATSRFIINSITILPTIISIALARYKKKSDDESVSRRISLIADINRTVVFVGIVLLFGIGAFDYSNTLAVTDSSRGAFSDYARIKIMSGCLMIYLFSAFIAIVSIASWLFAYIGSLKDDPTAPSST